jgi:hypothetical protein
MFRFPLLRLLRSNKTFRSFSFSTSCTKTKAFKVFAAVTIVSLTSVGLYVANDKYKFINTQKTKKSDKDTNFNELVVPIDIFLNNHSITCEKILPELESKSDETTIGPIIAFKVAGETLKVLKEKLGDCADCLQVSIIKGTYDHGTTSVSQGAAERVYNMPVYRDRPLVLLNCGTGGIKFQLAKYNGGKIAIVAESKTSSGELVPSPNALEIANYKPKNVFPFNENKQMMKDKLTVFLKEHNLPSDTLVFGFVTGTVREFWEKAKDEKMEYENKIIEYFKDAEVQPLANVLAIDNSSYYISQYDEGKLELLGTKSMFENLQQDSMLDPNDYVLGSFGIGKASSQLMSFLLDGKTLLLSHNAGMGKIDDLKGLPKAIETQLTDDVINKLKYAIIIRKKGGKPVICLKSGTVLLCESNDEVRKSVIKLS